MFLKQELEENGIADILETENARRRIVPEKLQCDLYTYLASPSEAGFNGSYMSNYSWAEVTRAELADSGRDL